MEMATKAKHWTLEELHALPDDGNKYELVFGDLFVTPPPSVGHEELAAVLERILDRYVERWGLGRVYRPRAVIQTPDGEVEPDLMVRETPKRVVKSWTDAPVPSLVTAPRCPGRRRRRDVPLRPAGVRERRLPAGMSWRSAPRVEIVRSPR